MPERALAVSLLGREHDALMQEQKQGDRKAESLGRKRVWLDCRGPGKRWAVMR